MRSDSLEREQNVRSILLGPCVLTRAAATLLHIERKGSKVDTVINSSNGGCGNLQKKVGGGYKKSHNSRDVLNGSTLMSGCQHAQHAMCGDITHNKDQGGMQTQTFFQGSCQSNQHLKIAKGATGAELPHSHNLQKSSCYVRGESNFTNRISLPSCHGTMSCSFSRVT